MPPPIPADWKLKVIGEHNRENASFAVAALRALGISEPEIRAGLESFEAVEGRLQFVREVTGVKLYNDNNATTPEATVAALRALSQKGFRKPLILIAGGSEKWLELKELVTEIKQRTTSVILLTHPNYKGSVRLAEELRQAGVSFSESLSLSDAVEKGIKGMNGGKGMLVFSPAFASFGMFKNEYDRNDQFIRLVKAL